MAIPVWTFTVKFGPLRSSLDLYGQVRALRQSHGGSLYGYPGLDLYGQVWTFTVKFGRSRHSLGPFGQVWAFCHGSGPFGQVRDTKVRGRRSNPNSLSELTWVDDVGLESKLQSGQTREIRCVRLALLLLLFRLSSASLFWRLSSVSLASLFCLSSGVSPLHAHTHSAVTSAVACCCRWLTDCSCADCLCRPFCSMRFWRFVFTPRPQALCSSRAIGPRRWPWLSFFCDQRTGVCDQGAFCPDSNNRPGSAPA